VIVGAKGRGNNPFLRIGSVAIQVAHHAPCSVLLVR
jgi:nucleotide-binding universal stress UspA family protein